MERAELVRRLERARRAVTEGETQIRRQRDYVFRLERAGKNTTEAQALLRVLLERQAQRQRNLALVELQFPVES